MGKNDAALAASAKHTSALAPVVNELAGLENEIQQLFAQAMWGTFNIGGKAAGKGRAGGGYTQSAPSRAEKAYSAPPEPAAPPSALQLRNRQKKMQRNLQLVGQQVQASQSGKHVGERFPMA